MESYERAWAEALAQEHAHQRELLATLRGELGTFAGECAAALTALDAVVGLGGVAGLLDTAKTGLRDAALVRDVGRRLAGLERAERTDRELLQGVADAAGARAQLEGIVGPAPVAALSALAPLARWVPTLRRADGGRELLASARKDLTQVLQSTAELTGETMAADAVALADSLRNTVEHVEQAAQAVAEGKLEAALAEARRRLEADLDELRAVHERAEGAPTEWRSARHTEHTALTEEVREKLDKVERLRGVLGLLLPHLQLTARALATVEKLRSLEGRLDPPAAAGVEAARLSLLLSAAEVWQASLPARGPSTAPARPAIRKRWFVVAALVLAAGVVGIALGLSGGSGKKQAVSTLPVTPLSSVTSTVPAAAAPAPKVSPVNAVFQPAQRATYYAVSARATGQGTPRYTWSLSPPKNDLTCTHFGSVPGAPNRAVWHHADTDGCNHAVMGPAGHLGTVAVTVTTNAWECTASFFGTNTQTGSRPPACRRL